MKLIHQYQLQKKLCENEFVQVFRATEDNSGKVFTLSLVNKAFEINPKILMRMVSDGEPFSLVHPHIAKIIDYGETEQQQYFVSDYIGSKTLSSFISESVSATFALDVISQLASALHFLSLQGYIHGNIHPDNIFFDSYGNAILSAFELVPKHARTNKLMPIADSEHKTVYTRYHSPEYIENNIADEVSDLYGLGVILFELLTATNFDDRKYNSNSVVKNVNELIPYLPQDNFGFQPVINKLLAKKPKQRYQNGLQLVDALNEYDSRLIGVTEMNSSLAFDDDLVMPFECEKTSELENKKYYETIDESIDVKSNEEKNYEVKDTEVKSTEVKSTEVDRSENNNEIKIPVCDEKNMQNVEIVRSGNQLHIPNLDLGAHFHDSGKSDDPLEMIISDVPFSNDRYSENRRYIIGGSVFSILMMSLLFFLPENENNTDKEVFSAIAPVIQISSPDLLDKGVTSEIDNIVENKGVEFEVDKIELERDGLDQVELNKNQLGKIDPLNIPPLITQLDVEDARKFALNQVVSVRDLLSRAQEYMERFKFTTPKDKNAYAMYSAILSIDPTNKSAKEGIVNIAESYAYMARRQISKHNYRKAAQYIAKGLVLQENNEWLIALKTELNQRYPLAKSGNGQIDGQVATSTNDQVNDQKFSQNVIDGITVNKNKTEAVAFDGTFE